jgi:hypothetical protein
MPCWVLKRDRVAACLGVLRGQRIHRQFAGYLCARRTAAAFGRTDGLRVDLAEFWGTFLRARGGPRSKPYIVAFIEDAPSSENEWLNENLAGSYAGSSVRRVSPILQVVEITGQRESTTWSLRDRHWQLARAHLCFGAPVPAIPLAVVFYRDFGFDWEAPDLPLLLDVFKHEFGYATHDGRAEFEHLYTVDSGTLPQPDWFEDKG